MLGPAPVVDFDGTLARLDIDWIGLRRLLNVARIDDLWDREEGWEAVTAAEVSAASVAEAVAPVLTWLESARCFAVLTSNDASAVHRFVQRFPSLEGRLSIVIGRAELGGPKTDFARFELGVRQCLEATERQRNGEVAVYVGDAPYELAYARELGLTAVDVNDLLSGSNDA